MSTPPTQIGPYTVSRELGRGGMGVVYLGHDPRLDRPVAIKTLPEHFAEDADLLERFEREAKALAQLNHPNVTGIYGIEEHEGRRYLILEYVEGETLADRLERGALPTAATLEICAGIARGVEAAHEAGIVHRDLKPANVRISSTGAVKVLDFGLAKAVAASLGLPAGDADPNEPTVVSDGRARPGSTQPGIIMGTAAYMSPEQARGSAIDKRTDIWSFGVVLYECLTGVSPFDGATASDSIGAILHKDIDLDRLPPDAPARVRYVLRRCLARDRSERLRDIGDARLELTSDDVEIAAGGARAPRRFGAWAALAAGILLGGLGSAAWILSRPSVAAPDVVRSSILAPEGIMISGFQIAPDGRQVSIIGEPAEIGLTPGPRATAMYVRDLRDESMTKVPGTLGAFTHRYAPDGRTIVFITRGAESSDAERVMRVPRDGSTAPVEIMRVPAELHWGPDSWFCWTPDQDLAFLDRSNGFLVVFDAGNGRELRRLTLSTGGPRPDYGDLDQPFGNRHVVVTLPRLEATGYTQDAGLIDIETGAVTTLVERGLRPRLIAPDAVLFSRSDSVYLSAFDPEECRLIGDLRRVQTGLATEHQWGNGDYEIAKDGTLVYLPGGVQGTQRELITTDPDGVTSVWFDERRPFEEHIAVSPDGARLAVVLAGASGLYEVWVSEVGQPRLRPLLSEPGADFYQPRFSPDGEELVVSRLRASSSVEKSTLLAARFDGTAAPRRIAGGASVEQYSLPLSVSHDGKRVLYMRTAQGMTALFEVPFDGTGEPRLVHRAEAIYSGGLPPTDDPLIAYVTTELGRAEVVVRTLEDGVLGPAIPVTTRGAWNSHWIIDDDHGLCILHFDLEWREWRTPIAFEAGRIRVGTAEPTGRRGDVRILDRDFTRDGTWLAIRRGADEVPWTRLELVQHWRP